MESQIRRSIKFSISIETAVITFVLAAIFSVISTSLLGVGWIIGLLIVLTIV